MRDSDHVQLLKNSILRMVPTDGLTYSLACSNIQLPRLARSY